MAPKRATQAGLVACPRCLQVFAHLSAHKNCKGRSQEVSEETESVGAETALWDGLPWPSGVPKPPKGMPHPNAFVQRCKLHTLVPGTARKNWVDLLTAVFNNFADQFCEEGTEQGMISSLSAVMGLARVLEKPRGGKKARRKVTTSVEKFAKAVSLGDLSSYTGGGRLKISKGRGRFARDLRQQSDKEG